MHLRHILCLRDPLHRNRSRGGVVPHPKADRLIGAEETQNLGSQLDRGKSSSAWTGSETTFGVPHGVGTSILRDAQTMLWVNTLLTTAATRPEQSTTGAPEAP